jgi:hypothetical protein
MYITPPFSDQVQDIHRHEAERKAAHWRLIRTLRAPSKPKKVMCRLWQRFGLLARIRKRQILRVRLKENAVR